MGQCMSRKAAGAFAASAAGAHNRPSKRKHAKLHESPDDNQKQPDPMNKNNKLTKGVASSFGFKRRPLTAPSALTTSSQTVGRRLAFTDSKDSNGNDQDSKPLTENFQTNGRSTPRLPPPKKDGIATQGVGRFGFRQSNLQVNRSNRVADLNAEQLGAPRGSSTPRTFLTSNNVASQNRYTNQRDVASKTSTNTVDKNRNRTAAVKTPAQSELIGRFTLQTTQLPKPQPVRVMNTKSAKTVANNNMKFSGSFVNRRQSPEDGSLTEDSGLGSRVGTDLDNNSPQTPTIGRLKHKNNLELMVNESDGTFELRDPDAADISLPKLPSDTDKEKPERSSFKHTGLVRQRTNEFERIQRKISATSSEGFSDASSQKENDTQHNKPHLVTQKSFLKPKPSPIHSFLKTKVIENKGYSSASSEDTEIFGMGGEALADEISVSISSSDESKEKETNHADISHLRNVAGVLSEDRSFLKKSLGTLPLKQEFRAVTLTIADSSTLEAVAAENSSEKLLDEETSPVDSLLSFTDTEDGVKKRSSSSESKDINDKPSPSTPSSPSNGSNSFPLPDEKDFLIDDEIADQPALLGDKSQRSDTTLVDNSTPVRRRKLKSFENSPLLLKNTGSTMGSNVSLDTLSPCESIGSEDMMLDFDCSHSSLDDDKLGKINSKKAATNVDESFNSVHSLEADIKNNEQIRDWSALLNGSNDRNRSSASRPRFIRSRTPSSVCESPNSLDGRSNNGRISTPSGSLRRFVQTTNSAQGYESDDSVVKLDRTAQATIKNDISAVKTMLFKLRGILNEQTIGELLESETRNPFEEQMNGQNNGSASGQNGFPAEAENDSKKVVDLQRQVLYLLGNLEDKERTVASLQDQLTKMSMANYTSSSAPASTTSMSKEMCNAATQTDRIRRLSTEPSLTNCSQSEATQGNLVSVTESPSRNDPATQKTTSTKEASMSPVYQRLSNSKAHTMIPRRSESRSRAPPSSLS